MSLFPSFDEASFLDPALPFSDFFAAARETIASWDRYPLATWRAGGFSGTVLRPHSAHNVNLDG
jgi:hypothetical protein